MPTKPRRKYEYSGPFHDLLRLVFDNTSESWVELARALAASLGPGRTFTNLHLVGEARAIASRIVARLGGGVVRKAVATLVAERLKSHIGPTDKRILLELVQRE
jgi:hypothetical protein